MSGDVQPRKRKDKKKKKDEQIEDTVAQPQPPSTPVPPNDDVNIHVHKERSLGGGVCAKCVFFLLMVVISVIIGFTITDYRGQTDVEIPEAESRFASIFEGWIETTTDSHDDDDHEAVHSEEASHEEEESDESRHDDDDDDDGNDDHDSDDREEEEAEEEEVTEEEPEEEEDDEEEQNSSSEDRRSDEADDDDEEIEDISESRQEDEDDEIGENEGSQEVTDEVESDGEEEDIPAEEESQELQQDEPTDVTSENESEEIKRPEEDVSEEEDDQREKVVEINEENVEPTTVNMAAKVGVGLSLFIVAYVVLVKKWRTDKPAEEDTIKDEHVPTDLSRRNTFVPPPTLEEVEQDIENVEEEYSDEDEEVEESDDERKTMPAGKRHYEELRSTYRRTLPAESDSKKYGDSEEDEDEGQEEDEDEEEGEIDDEQYEEEIEEEEDEIDDEFEDDEDEKLMKKLEARYGRLGAKSSSKYADEENDDEDEDDKNFRSWKRIKKTGSEAESESENEKSSAQSVYEFQNITNAEDYIYKEELDDAQRHLSNNIQVGLNIFIKFLESHPNSPRALYGKAEALDLLADKKRSNEILQDSIQSYLNVINSENVPPVLFLKAAERCINRMRFIGNYGRAISVHKKLIQRFPNESKHKNDLAVTYLTINRISEARSLLIDILNEYPNNGFALVHYGFILKTVDNDFVKAIDYLKRGIETREDGVIDGRFYFHLGDALARLGKNNEAMQIYEDGVSKNVFLSKYQRSLYNVDRLTGRPWWTKEETPYNRLYEQLERHYHQIKEEGLAVLNQKGFFKDESENLRDVGDWKQFELYARGVKHAENCKKCPLTCKIIDSEPDVKTCRRGQVKFSVMHPGTHVWPHCGPTNCRLRIHLGLKVPPKTYIRVGEEIRSWEEGRIFIFDDSFEHEVWHNGTEFRLVLIIDVWHPELTKNEKYYLSAI